MPDRWRNHLALELTQRALLVRSLLAGEQANAEVHTRRNGRACLNDSDP